MREHLREPCDHQWRFSNSRNVFFCTSCFEIDDDAYLRNDQIDRQVWRSTITECARLGVPISTTERGIATESETQT